MCICILVQKFDVLVFVFELKITKGHVFDYQQNV